jgi:hypothetical protein
MKIWYVGYKGRFLAQFKVKSHNTPQAGELVPSCASNKASSQYKSKYLSFEPSCSVNFIARIIVAEKYCAS